MKTICSVLLFLLGLPAARAGSPPNVVLIYADDLGYGDLSCYGNKAFKTPNLDRLAAEGMRFTDFYVAQPVCSASRAALLTGCYSNRVGILGALNPRAQTGIGPYELSMAEMLRSKGYATAIYGKWHLGNRPEFLPTRHGFDEYYGLPYSNDMWPRHPTVQDFPKLPLIDGEKVIQSDPDQSQLTSAYTERAVRFIEKNRKRPFFLYVPHSMPHVPIFVSSKHKDKSGAGLYGDVIQEIDWSVGQILEALKKHKLERNTLVMFCSDNGPWLSYGNHAGSSGGFREGKGTTFEGGVRVPFIARWPDRIPRGKTCGEPAMTIDLLPTLAGISGASLPSDRVIDGKDIWPLISGAPNAKTPHEALFFYWNAGLQAVRSGKWKLHFPHPYTRMAGPAGQDGKPNGYRNENIELSLYDLEKDPAESVNVAAQNPDVVKRLTALADKMRADLGDSLTGKSASGARPPGKSESPAVGATAL
jgi:arylsulfatase A-like enzyme